MKKESVLISYALTYTAGVTKSPYPSTAVWVIGTLWHVFGDLLPPVQLSKYMDTKLGGGGG